MAHRSNIPWKDWISWIALIMLAAEIAVLTLCYPVSKAGDGNAFGLVVIGTIAFLDAAAQWLWIRSRTQISIWWIPANILGWYMAAGFIYIDFFPAVARLASLRADLLCCSDAATAAPGLGWWHGRLLGSPVSD